MAVLSGNLDQPVDMMEIARQTTRRDVERLPRGAVKVIAPAKVNLYLAVGARRPDGYHEVKNLMQTVMLHDVVYLWLDEAASPGSVSCECVAYEGLEPVDVAPEHNLAVRAVRALAAEGFGVGDGDDAPGADAAPAFPALGIRIEKHIPAQAGLAGGSADAAAALVGAAQLWVQAGALDAADVGPEVLSRVGASVGADVPFLLFGGAALMGGTGTELLRTFASRKDPVVIICPGVGLSTAAMYRALDEAAVAREQSGETAPETALATEVAPEPELTSATASTHASAPALALSDDDFACCLQNRLPDLLRNDFQEPAIAAEPVIGRIIEFAAAQPGVTAVQMTGSGSGVFAVCTDFGSACKLAASAKLAGWWARTTAFGPVRTAVTPV